MARPQGDVAHGNPDDGESAVATGHPRPLRRAGRRDDAHLRAIERHARGFVSDHAGDTTDILGMDRGEG